MRAARRCLIVLFGLLALAGAGLQTPWAKDRLAATLSRVVSEAVGMPVEIRDLTGVIPVRVGVGSISAADDEGPWLELDAVSMRWGFLALRHGELHVRHFRVGELRVLRRPPPRKQDPAKPPDPGAPPLLPLRIDEAAVSRVFVASDVAGQDVEARIQARGAVLPDSGHLDVEAHYRVGTQPECTAQVRWRREEGRQQLAIDTGLPVLPVLQQPAHLNATLRFEDRQVDAVASVEAGGSTFVRSTVTGSLQHLHVDARVAGLPIQGEAAIRGDRVEGRLACPAITPADLPDVPAAWETLALTVGLSGTRARPRLEFRGDVTGFQSEHAALRDHPPLQGGIHGVLDDTGLRANAKVDAGTRLDVVADAVTPAEFSLAPLRASVDLWNPTQASVRGKVDLSLFNDLPIRGKLRLFGEGVADLHYDGSTRSIRIGGPTHIRNGRFLHTGLGTELNDIHASFDVEEDRRLIMEATGQAGATGKVSLHGVFQRGHESTVPARVTVELQDASLLERDDIQATVTGRAEWVAGKEGMALTGALTVDAGEIRIDQLAGGTAKPLAVREVGGARPPAAEAPPPSTARAPLPLTGQVTIAIPGPFRVRGRDLDTTWRGNLQASREPAGWGVNGQLETVRGRVTFLSRSFTLDSGTLYLGGNIPPTPVLDLSARHRRSDITAIIRLHGPLQDPEIDLSSIPPLPEDEVFAYVLFGKGMSDITTLQGLSLANALRTEGSGRQRRASVGERVQDRLGVDYVGLQEGADEDRSTEVVLGRQFSSSTYVEFNSSLGGAGSGVRVELELTPRLSVETEAGRRMRPGFGLNWRWNY